MPDFDNLKPPKNITDPKGLPEGFKEFPRHMHKADGEYIEVVDEVGKAKAIKDGYKDLPFPSEPADAADSKKKK